MISASVLHRVFTVTRRTSVIVQPRVVAAQVTPDVTNCPHHDAFVEIDLVGNGDGLTGTITVKGTPADEDIPVSGPIANDKATVRSCERFTCIDRIDFSGIASPATFRARLIGTGGEPVHVNYELADCVVGHVGYIGQGVDLWPVIVPGAQERGRGYIVMNDVYEWKPREGDVFIEADGTRWEVITDPDYLGVLRPHHFEIEVERRQGTDIEIRT